MEKFNFIYRTSFSLSSAPSFVEQTADEAVESAKNMSACLSCTIETYYPDMKLLCAYHKGRLMHLCNYRWV